jgi:hypothetical protein
LRNKSIFQISTLVCLSCISICKLTHELYNTGIKSGVAGSQVSLYSLPANMLLCFSFADTFIRRWRFASLGLF